MKKALIIQHMDHDHAGRFLDFFSEDGIVPETVRVFEGQKFPSLASFDLLFVLGGAQDTWEEDKFPYLAEEKQIIREWVNERAKPYFGICLGHQLLAVALGGEVAKGSESEVGVFEVEATTEGAAHQLFDKVPRTQPVMQWHHAEVKKLPPGATVLAGSKSTSVQAIAIDGHAASTQFHCEFTPQTVAGWQSMPSYMLALEKEHGAGAYSALASKCLPLMPQMNANTRQMWQNFKVMTGLNR
jgi:GMP synthase-like glutamine amidotransferase